MLITNYNAIFKTVCFFKSKPNFEPHLGTGGKGACGVDTGCGILLLT